MANPDPSTIEKYQKLYEKDPKSKVFAPLAEAYRQMGLQKEAEEICRQGIRSNPEFAGGRIALARLLLDKNQIEAARSELETAIRLSPENALALSLLGDTHLRLKNPKSALKAFKMLLFLSPENEKAKNAVKKLESLTANEYDEDAFAMQTISKALKQWEKFDAEQAQQTDEIHDQLKNQQRMLDRLLSLSDAHMARNDQNKALEALTEAEKLFGSHAEVVRRLKIIHQRDLEQIAYPKTALDLKPVENREEQRKNEKLLQLKSMLKTFQELRKR